ncbi:unnamed protein product [Pleuronectes platessa]|uniref:Solute carrier family 10 member 1 n=1 Tax=Pleuronectes platessa TaxID=8262 RepID=A0A9N7UQ72_PLEPL|nr:unnamed protein product [Pleuronectes platessa]
MDDAAPSWQNDSFLSFNTTAAMSPVVDKALKALTTTLLCIVMVSLGCTMELSKIKMHFMKPKGLVIALLSQYGVMPFTAFCLAKAFQLTDIRALVILICGCSPGGNLSNVLTLALMGDNNLSIVMTACSMLLALGMMPLLLLIYCQGFPHLQEALPYVGIVISLSLLVIASAVGILINFYRPRYANTVKKVAFPPAVMGPLFMFPMVFAFFQLTEGAVIVGLFRCHRRFTQKRKVSAAEAYKPAPTDDNANVLL